MIHTFFLINKYILIVKLNFLKTVLDQKPFGKDLGIIQSPKPYFLVRHSKVASQAKEQLSKSSIVGFFASYTGHVRVVLQKHYWKYAYLV